jgi:hypothetical protein
MSRPVLSAASEEKQESLLISSPFFGRYTVPRRCIDSMSSQHIIAHVSAVANEAMVSTPPPSPDHQQPQAMNPVDTTDEHVVDVLHCASRLRADLPVLARQHVASVISRHWMYLVWMHLIECDAAPVSVTERDRALWSLIRRLEWSHNTLPQPRHKQNRRAVFTVKQGMLLTSLLLSDDNLMASFVAALGISPDALLSLPRQQLHIDNLRHLVGQLYRPGVPQRITRSNVKQLLLPCPTTAVAELPSENQLPANQCTTSSQSPADDRLLALVPASDSAASKSCATAGNVSTTMELCSRSVMQSEVTGCGVEAEPRVTTRLLCSRPDEQSTSPPSSTPSFPSSSSSSPWTIEQQLSDGEDEEGVDEDSEAEESSADDSEHKEDDDEGSALGEREQRTRTVRKHSASQHKRSFPASSKRKRSNRLPGSRELAVSRRKRAALSLDEESSASASPAAAVAEPLHTSDQCGAPAATSAVQWLRAVTFRHPDVVLCCVDDDMEHDLFCRHHQRWRREALHELMKMPRDAFQRQVQECHDQQASLHLTDPAQFYTRLLCRWGHRIQFVAPIQMDSNVVMQQSMKHHSLELHSHDIGCLFYSHDFLLERGQGLRVLPAFSRSSAIPINCLEVLAAGGSSPSLASSTGFEDAGAALSARNARKYWVLASDHVRDARHGNSAHLLDLYRLLSGDEASSFDAQSGVMDGAPLDWLLGLGCMLVVVVQTEGTVVLVPSAEANESAHVVSTGPDTAVVSVAGNLLSPRHIARLVRQHEEDAPTEEVRVEWVQHEVKKARKVDATESYHISDALSMQVPTASLIEQAHFFLGSVKEQDQRYQIDCHRQSWIPDLFFNSQACKLVSDYLDHHSLPLSVLEQLVDMGCSATTRATVAALLRTAVLAASRASSSSSLATTTDSHWHSCRVEYGCPTALTPMLPQAHSGPFQQLQSIHRPPVLLATPDESTQAQRSIIGIVHDAIGTEKVTCNSFLSPAPGVGAAEPEYRTWPDDENGLKFEWVQEALTQQRTVYLTDIVSRSCGTWKQRADGLLAAVLGQHTTTGFLLHHCSYPTPGVHSPSYFALFSNAAALKSAVAQSTPHHNESHRCAAWHLLLRHPKQSVIHRSPSVHVAVVAADSSLVIERPVVNDAVSSAAIATIFRALAAKTDIHEGNSVLADGMASSSVRTRGSTPSRAARDLYPLSVSRALGQLTMGSGEKIINALQLTPFTRLLDVGSGFGRFCIQAALSSGAPVTGIEAIHSTAQHAERFLSELFVEHSDVMASVFGKIRLVKGDILAHLSELFNHRRLFLFDKGFVEKTWSTLAYLFSYLADVSDLRIMSCQPMHLRNSDLVQGEKVELNLSKSRGQSFAAHVYTIDQQAKRRHLVEVFLSGMHRLGVRATRAIQHGSTIMFVHGEIVYDGVIDQQSEAWRQERLPYLVRTPSEDKKDMKAFMYAWGISRYIKIVSHTRPTPNVKFATLRNAERQLYVMATQHIAKGEELFLE